MFPVTITLHSHEQLSRVLAVMATEPAHHVPKSAAASDASGPATARENAAPTKTAKEKTPTAASAEGKPQASTVADAKKTEESAPAAAQSAAPAAAATTGTTNVEFVTARLLVLKLANTYRAQIKEINAKHGIAKLGALLDDENDFATVNDQAKLDAVYADLLLLGA